MEQAYGNILNANPNNQRSQRGVGYDRLLSVVMECNTEHQDPSRVTNQEDSREIVNDDSGKN